VSELWGSVLAMDAESEGDQPESPSLRTPEWSEVEGAFCPECQKRLPDSLPVPLPRETHRAIWIEVPLDDTWSAAYRLIAHDEETVVVAEARVFAKDSYRWSSGRIDDRPGLIPEFGIPGKIMDRLRLTDPVEAFPRALARWKGSPGQDWASDYLSDFCISVESTLQARAGGKLPDRIYAVWAKAYVKHCRAGRDPIQALADDPPTPVFGSYSDGRRASEDAAKSRIKEARKRELLTSPTSDNKCGELTDLGRKALGFAGPEV